MRQIYAIFYNNGERYDDHWSGISEKDGMYSTREGAENKVKQLQMEHDFRIKEEIAQGYAFPSHENESWSVQPVTLFD